MTHALGARRSHPDKIARTAPAHLHPKIRAALATPLPSSVDLSPHAPPILDQGSTGSCTAHAIAAAVVITTGAAGKPLGFVPSPRLTYAATRAFERAAATPAGATLPELTDSGAEIADVMSVLSADGVRPMMGPTSDGRISDVEPANVNAEPAIEDLEVAATKPIVGPYTVDMAASNVSDVLAAALAAGIAIDIAFLCDSAFQALGPGDVAQAPDTSDPSAGGHSTCLDGYVTAADGTRQFWLRNSWSIAWGTSGRTLVSPAFIAALWEAWPVVVSA